MQLCMWAGVEDNGYPRGLNRQDLEQSIQTLTAMTEAAGAALQTLQEMPATDGRSYLIAKVVRLCRDELSYTDLRIAGAFFAPLQVRCLTGRAAAGYSLYCGSSESALSAAFSWPNHQWTDSGQISSLNY